MMMNSIQDDSLIQEFITESQEHLGDIEPDLLEMEQQAPEVDHEIVNRIFRAIHSIKGASGFFGFERLKGLSHVMESVLMRIRDKELQPQSYIVEPLLKGVDKMREMLDDISNSEQVDSSALEVELSHYLQNETPFEAEGEAKATKAKAKAKKKSAPKGKANPKANTAEPDETNVNAAQTVAFNADADALKRASAIGQFLYVVQVQSARDLHGHNRSASDLNAAVQSIGTLLDSTLPEAEQDAPPETYHLLFATVLELDLVPGALEVPTDAVQAYAYDAVPTKPAISTPKVPAPPAKTESATTPPLASKHESHENETIRVRVDLLNKLMDFAGELVLSRNQLIRAASEQAERLGIHDEGLSRIVQSMNTTTSYLQEHIMQTRMQPIESVFRRFPRVVRDLANQLGKKIKLEMIGQDVELDKTILESLSDPLTHMVRNCCDHGLETPEVRESRGKNPEGKITLHAYHQGGQIHLAITDDGNGIDTDRVGAKAIRNGLITQAQFDAMPHQERLNLIFHPGLSTAETISDVSGRGVGMDVVRANIEKLGGHIFLESEKGKGSRVTLQLPLTLAIIPSLVVGLQGHRFAIPQVNLLELVRVRANETHQKIEKVGKASVLRLRGRWLPLIKLADVLNVPQHFTHPQTQEATAERRESIEDERFNDPQQVEQIPEIRRESLESDYNIVVLSVGSNQYGLIVDEVFDTEEIVVKPLSHFLKNIKCFSGTTIMGDGKVAMICDVAGIATHSRLNFSEVEAEQNRRQEAREQRHGEGAFSNAQVDADRRSVILFSNHNEEQFALPLGDLLRLERIKLSEIELVGNREFVTYRDTSIPLIRLEDYISVRPSQPESDDAFMIIPKQGNGCAGIFATRILDTIEVDTALNEHLIGEAQVSGSAIINNHLTLFINSESLLNSAGVWIYGAEEVQQEVVVNA